MAEEQFKMAVLDWASIRCFRPAYRFPIFALHRLYSVVFLFFVNLPVSIANYTIQMCTRRLSKGLNYRMVGFGQQFFGTGKEKVIRNQSSPKLCTSRDGASLSLECFLNIFNEEMLKYSAWGYISWLVFSKSTPPAPFSEKENSVSEKQAPFTVRREEALGRRRAGDVHCRWTLSRRTLTSLEGSEKANKRGAETSSR